MIIAQARCVPEGLQRIPQPAPQDQPARLHLIAPHLRRRMRPASLDDRKQLIQVGRRCGATGLRCHSLRAGRRGIPCHALDGGPLKSIMGRPVQCGAIRVRGLHTDSSRGCPWPNKRGSCEVRWRFCISSEHRISAIRDRPIWAHIAEHKALAPKAVLAKSFDAAPLPMIKWTPGAVPGPASA